MQKAATTSIFASADKRLAELMKTFGCADVIAPVDPEAFGKRAGELLTHVAFGKSAEWVTRVVSGEHVLRNVLKIDRVRPGGPPRVRMPSQPIANGTLSRQLGAAIGPRCRSYFGISLLELESKKGTQRHR